jgi:hypothetical protein
VRTYQRLWPLLFACASALPARADERTHEQEMFGSEEPPNEMPAFAALAPPSASDEPLTLGGELYMRAQATAHKGQPPGDYRLNTPSLLDLFLDARPHERLRSFVRGRLSYDAAASSAQARVPAAAGSATSSLAGAPSLGGANGSYGPRVALDQLWLRFDIAQTAFLTLGRQHVRWGTGRFWMPTDFLHLRRRGALDVVDARVGTMMVKLHLPIEKTATNLYGYLVFESLRGRGTLSQVSLATRAEYVLGTNELALGAIVPLARGGHVKLACDVSSALGPLDVYGEAALLHGSESQRVRYAPDAVVPDPIAPAPWVDPQAASYARLQQITDTLFPVAQRERYVLQAVLGTTWTGNYGDNSSFTLGAEYFYNGLGYDDPSAYPGLLLPHGRPLRAPAPLFYLGRHYAATYVDLPSPFGLEAHSFRVTTIANLSDGSLITRLDHSFSLYDKLRIESYFAAHYGAFRGEFRFGLDGPQLDGIPLRAPPTTFDIGLALRLAV